MIEQSRHVPLWSAAWDPDTAAEAINEIVTDALARFDRERFWPAHPLDDGIKDGHSSIYFGAAGVCRIISARRAERHEQERYWKNRSLQP
jgi:hypothetical protein